MHGGSKYLNYILQMIQRERKFKKKYICRINYFKLTDLLNVYRKEVHRRVSQSKLLTGLFSYSVDG